MIEIEKKTIKSGEFLKKIRKTSELTQKEFAKKVNVTQQYISEIERNQCDLSLSIFVRWCKKINISDVNNILLK